MPENLNFMNSEQAIFTKYALTRLHSFHIMGFHSHTSTEHSLNGFYSEKKSL